MQIQIKHLKPYIFILAFLLVPLILFQIIKKVLNQDKYIDNAIIPQEQFAEEQPKNSMVENVNFGIIIHGGAGNISHETLTAEEEIAYKTKLFEAIQTGKSMLENNDSAVYIVQAVIKILEDSPLFNAGKGAVLNNKGQAELDASIMDGRTMDAGAVAGVKTVKNPIDAALTVMQKSNYVMLAGQGADEFSKINHLTIVPQKYFHTQKSLNRLKKAQMHKKNEKHGTVGCVVKDKFGNLSSGTSTGGLNNKAFGRIGDSPVIGAGTYADNSTCAISCTGIGEFFIRYNIAYDISALMKYKNARLSDATRQVIKKLSKNGGSGGVIAIDNNGNISIEFNTNGMFRAYSVNNQEPIVKLFKE